MAPIKFLGIGASLLLCALVSAQERDNRVIDLGGFVEHQLLWFGESGEAFARPAQFNAIEYTVDPAMQLAGDAQYLDGGGAGLPSLVLCGRDPTAEKGVLQLVVWDEPTSSYITPPGGIFELPLSDFVGVAWSGQNQLMFLLDATYQLIWMAPYTAGDPLPVTWTPLITSATEPALASVSGR